MATAPYTIKGPELAGFDLACYIREDCTIQMLDLQSDRMEIPKKVRVNDIPYALDSVMIGQKTIYEADIDAAHVTRAMRLVGHKHMVYCLLHYT